MNSVLCREVFLLQKFTRTIRKSNFETSICVLFVEIYVPIVEGPLLEVSLYSQLLLCVCVHIRIRLSIFVWNG